jgi:hypothetical protein
MPLLKQIKDEAAVIKGAPASFIVLALVCGAVGFYSAAVVYKHELSGLREEVNYWKSRSEQKLPPTATSPKELPQPATGSCNGNSVSGSHNSQRNNC